MLLLNAYPLYQMVATNGHLFYMNAYDESSYLQYDFSMATQSMTRVAQYLVTASHELGLSGGWINLIFDLITVPVIMIFAARSFQLLERDQKDSNFNAFLLTTLPLLFCGFNPLIRNIFEWSLDTGAISWITTPEALFLPYVRTPEPQFSLALLSVVIFWSLKRQSFWYLYPILPFLYPFVAVPAAFILLSLHLRKLFPRIAQTVYWTPLISFFIIGFALFVYFNLLVPRSIKEFLTETHLPLISVTGIECLLITAWGYRRCAEQNRHFLVICAATPLAVTNMQIISGHLGSPNAHEQYFGTLCAAVVFIFCLKTDPRTLPAGDPRIQMKQSLVSFSLFRKSLEFMLSPQVLRKGLLLFASIILLVSGRHMFRENYSVNERFPFNPEVRRELRYRSHLVAIDNQRLAAVANMIYPKQPSTLLGYERSFAPVCTDQGFQDYLLAKKTLLNDDSLSEHFRKMLQTLDDGYRYENEDFILLHIGRKQAFHEKHNPALVPEEDETRKFYYVLTNDEPPPSPRAVFFHWMKNAVSNIRGKEYQ